MFTVRSSTFPTSFLWCLIIIFDHSRVDCSRDQSEPKCEYFEKTTLSKSLSHQIRFPLLVATRIRMILMKGKIFLEIHNPRLNPPCPTIPAIMDQTLHINCRLENLHKSWWSHSLVPGKLRGDARPAEWHPWLPLPSFSSLVSSFILLYDSFHMLSYVYWWWLSLCLIFYVLALMFGFWL